MRRIFAVAALFTSSQLIAQTDTTSQTLNEVIVTANKFPQKQKNVGKVITVITQEELRRNSGRSLGDVLNMQSGVFINGAQNTLGTNQDVYVRGASTGKALILIDGVPVYDPSGTSTVFDINLIPVNQIERVEILKGSQSTLYGSDAMAGVINIITRKGTGKPVSVIADLAAGSYGTLKGSAGIYGTKKQSGYSVQYTKVKSHGFTSAYDPNHTGTFDKDGFDQDAVLANFTHHLSQRLTLRLNGQYASNRTELDAGAFADDKDYQFDASNIVAGAGADYKLNKAFIHFNYTLNHTKRSYLDDSTSVGGFSKYSNGEYKGLTHLAEVYSNLSLHKHLDLLVGADYRQQNMNQEYLSISSFGPYKTALSDDSATLKQWGVYTSVILKELHGFNIEAGMRYNHFNQYGNVYTFSFNPSYLINNRVKLFANLSSGFQSPTIYQLYSEYRNPTTDLKPEKSVSFDAGIQYFKQHVDLKAVYFRRRIKDNIFFFSEGAPFYRSYYINTDKQNDQGIELEAQTSLDQWHLSLNYTHVTGHVRTKTANGNDTTYNNLFRRPENTINLIVGYTITPALYTSLGIRSVSKRYEAIYGTTDKIEMAPYYTWNAYAEYKITEQIKAFADLRNLTDEFYMDINGYSSRRFNFMAGINLTF